MSTLGLLFVMAWLLASSLPAHSAPQPGSDCDATWGQHSLTPAPVSSPPVNTPAGFFSWGAHAYLDGNGLWWTWNFVRNLNGPNGAKLPVHWEKGNVTRSTFHPLEGESAACSNDFIDLPSNIEPKIDPNAPIEYGVNRTVQRAVVYHKPPPPPASDADKDLSQTPTKPHSDAGIQSLGNDPTNPAERDSSGSQGADPSSARRDNPTISLLQTSYRDANNEKQHIRVLFSSDRTSDRFQIVLQKQPESLIVGVSDFLKALDKDQAAQVQSSIKEQGITVTQGSLGTFSGPEARESLYLSADDPLLSNGLLFFGAGPKLIVSYSAPPSTISQRRQALLIIFDIDRRPIAAKRMDILVPEQKR